MPLLPIQHAFDLAQKNQAAGKLQEAEKIYRQILTQQPEHVEALRNLGIIAQRTGRREVAVDLLGRAIQLRPDLSGLRVTLGLVLREQGRIDDAIALYREAIALRGEDGEAYYNLGNALKEKGLFADAVEAYRSAIAHRPGLAQAHYNLGIALLKLRRMDDAIAAWRQAIVLKPDFVEALGNLANALQEAGKSAEAIDVYQKAIRLRPDNAQLHFNLGIALRDAGRVDESVVANRQAIALQPEFAPAHNNLALVLLLQGNLRQGWEEYEWRSQSKEFPSTVRKFAQPQWDGSDPGGRRILLFPEQGIGDTIQFIRYATLVANRGGRVIFCCYPELRRLLEQVSGIEQWVAPGEAFPPFDVHCPLLSLPRAFGTTLESIPATIPYLFPDADLRGSWHARLAVDSQAFKVGLAWAGGRKHLKDHSRSMNLSDFLPLTEIPGVRFYSLQKGQAAAQVGRLAAGTKLIDWTTDLNDFADTAALMANLDLVISVDTAVAHLAGAIGKPVWTLLPFAPDWRWMLHRSDSPWYPTMRLFRQPTAGDWASVIARVAEALRQQLG